jgi:hypothetical protein
MPPAAVYSFFCPHFCGGLSARSRQTELLLNCARIGFNP